GTRSIERERSTTARTVIRPCGRPTSGSATARVAAKRPAPTVARTKARLCEFVKLDAGDQAAALRRARNAPAAAVKKAAAAEPKRTYAARRGPAWTSAW